MSARPVVIFGTGQLAEIAAYYFDKDTDRSVAGYVVDSPDPDHVRFNGQEIVGSAEVATRFPPDSHDAFVAIGYSKVNAVRQAKCEAMRALGYRLASYVSSRAVVFDNVVFGDNCFILEHNTVQPFVQMGCGIVLWSGNHIGHHSTIGDYAFISSHVVVSGNCSVGARSFLGVNSTLNDGIAVGERCVIGSGCLISSAVPDEGVLNTPPAELSRVPSSRLRGF